jgi:hypothetical protein
VTMKDKSAGDPVPKECSVIEVHVPELWRLFNAIDPSPFHDKDLDPGAEEFIVNWARELPRDARLALLVYLDRAAGLSDEAPALGGAIREFFRRRAETTRQGLRRLFSRGRISLLIALAFLALSIAISDILAMQATGRVTQIIREGLTIGGWVAMWRPLEIFLYDWWPIRAEARLADRLAAMPVRIQYLGDETSESWRRDWPAAAPERSARQPAS